MEEAKRASAWPAAAVLAAITAYVAAVLYAEKQTTISILFTVGIVAVLSVRVLGLLKPIGRSFASHETAFNVSAAVAMLAIAAVFRNEHFVLLLAVTFMLYAIAALGLTIQFGYAGVVNFAGASFFGIGAYTSAVLMSQTALPHLAILFLGGVTAALCQRNSATADPADQRALRRCRYNRVRTAFQEFCGGKRRPRRAAGNASSGHGNPRMVFQQ